MIKNKAYNIKKYFKKYLKYVKNTLSSQIYIYFVKLYKTVFKDSFWKQLPNRAKILLK